MKTPLCFTRKIDVCCWRVTAEVARATKRDWEIAVLKLVRQRKKISGADVSELLLDGREAVARRLLLICARLGLLREEGSVYSLTDAGEAAATSGQVFIPEIGTWTLWASREPLLPSPILRLEPWTEPSAYDEIIKKGQPSRGRFESLPQWVTDVCSQPLTPAAGGGEALRIDNFGKEQKGEWTEAKGTLQIALTVSPDGVRLALSGNLNGQAVSVSLSAPGLVFEDVWMGLLDREGLRSSWDEKRRVLLVAFHKTDERERATFQRAQPFNAPQLDGLGLFDALTVSEMALFPHLPADAQEWARWRLIQSIEGYATLDRYKQWSAKACEPFQSLFPTLPTRGTLGRELRTNKKEKPAARYWHLQATEDWKL